MTTGFCRLCLAPVPLDRNGKVAAHKEQIVSAHGWAAGYTPCRAKGTNPIPNPEQEK